MKTIALPRRCFGSVTAVAGFCRIFSYLRDYHVRAIGGTEELFTVLGVRFKVVFEQHLGEG